MREKLLNLMKEEKLTSSRLAELLGIQPSGISHILKGRNNPSLDFIQKILRRFPQVNPDWLILGEGPMYRSAADATSEAGALADSNSFENSNTEDNHEQREANYSHPNAAQPIENSAAEEKSKFIVSSGAATTMPEIDAMINASTRSRIRRVIILFEDRTFESYEPGR